MDKASLIGLIVGTVCLGIVFMESSHGHLIMFYSQEGVLMVFGGSISVVFMSMPMDKLLCVVGFLKAFMFHKGRDPVETVKMMSELAEKTASDHNTLRAMLVLLEQRGLTVRRPHPTDGRARHVSLTSEGRRVYRKLWKRTEQLRSVMLGPLSEEDLNLLVALLRRLSSAMNQPRIRLSPENPSRSRVSGIGAKRHSP